MNEDQSIELKFKTASTEALNAVESLLKSFNGLNSGVERVSTKVDKEGRTISKTVKVIREEANKLYTTVYKIGKDNTLSNVTTTMRDLDNATGLTTKSVEKFKNAFTITGAYMLIKSIVNKIEELTSSSSELSEQLNLFNVTFKNVEKNGKQAFSSIGQEATKFQYKLNEAFGTNKAETLYMQGIFQAMGETVDIPQKYAALMSETMTKLSYDLASLYNKNEKDTAEALRAGVYAGQTKPLRSYGIDVTQASLSPIAQDLGITKSVKNMSQAEKEILRYIAALKQAKNAMGDFANTIESPSNQLKIFKQQIVEMKAAISNLFMGIFNQILPYANAIIMVIKEVAKALGSLLGVSFKDYNSGLAGYNSQLDDTSKSAKKAANSVKELKRQTFGFDEIHNISENKNSGSGDTASTGIDNKLLEALYGYENGMEKVRMKATEIRDNIMKWLGFTKEIDPLTGEVSFKLNNGLTNIKLIGIALAGITGLKLFTKISKAVKDLKEIKKTIGNSGILKSLKEIIKSNTKLDSFFKSFGKFSSGLTILLTGLKIIDSSMVSVADNGFNVANSLGAIAGEAASIVGGALMASTVGISTAMGGAIGAVAGLITAIVKYEERVKQIENLETLFNNQGTSLEIVSEKIATIFENCVDDKAITNIENLATSWDNSKTSVDEARTSVDDLIESLKLQIQYGDKISKEQKQELMNAYDKIAEATRIANKASDDYYISLLKNHLKSINASKEDTANQIADLKALQSAKNEYSEKYIEEEKKIVKKWAEGKITLEQYNDKIEKLQIKYGYLANETVNAEGVIKNFSDMLTTIDYGDKDKAVSTISGVKTKYEETTETLKNYKSVLEKSGTAQLEEAKKQIENLEQTKKNVGSLSKTQQEIYDTLSKYVNGSTDVLTTSIEDVDKQIQKVQGEYKGYISRIYGELSSKGLETSKEFKSTCDNIKEDLETLKDVDMSGFGKKMFDEMIKDVVENKPAALQKLSNEFNKLGINAGDEFVTALQKQMGSEPFKRKVLDSSVETGQAIPQGIRKGATEYVNKYGTGIEEVAQCSIDEFKKTCKINSPSKVFETFGIYLVQGLINGITDEKPNLTKSVSLLLTDMKKQFDSSKFNINISTDVEKSFNAILSKLQNFISKFRSGINSLLSSMKISMNGIKVDGNGRVTYTAMPNINVQKFANGGFPEDGFFYANHTELVGKFANGKTVVANNEQIIDGIQSGVYQAVVSAMSQFGGNASQIDVHVHTDEGTVVDRINQKTKQTGVCPINIPY